MARKKLGMVGIAALAGVGLLIYEATKSPAGAATNGQGSGTQGAPGYGGSQGSQGSQGTQGLQNSNWNTGAGWGSGSGFQNLNWSSLGSQLGDLLNA